MQACSLNKFCPMLLKMCKDSIIMVDLDPVFQVIFYFMIVAITTINNFTPHTLLYRISFTFCITFRSSYCFYIESGVEQSYIYFILEMKYIFCYLVNWVTQADNSFNEKANFICLLVFFDDNLSSFFVSRNEISDDCHHEFSIFWILPCIVYNVLRLLMEPWYIVWILCYSASCYFQLYIWVKFLDLQEIRNSKQLFKVV